MRKSKLGPNCVVEEKLKVNGEALQRWAQAELRKAVGDWPSICFVAAAALRYDTYDAFCPFPANTAIAFR